MRQRLLIGLLASAAVVLPATRGGSLPLGRGAASTPAIRIGDVEVTEGGPGSLTLETLAALTEHAWAWGSEAKLFLDGARLYVPLGGGGLALYDVSDPRLPRLLSVAGTVVLGGQGGAVAASGSRAYVATPELGSIVVLDVSQPSAPTVLARFGSIPDIRQLVLRGSHLFVNAGSSYSYQGGVYVFDVSTTPPAPAGQYLTDLVDPGFYVSESGIVFLARTPADPEDTAKIDVIDMSAPGAPKLVSRWLSKYPGNITEIDLRDGRLFCSAYWGGLWILDAADPSHLNLLVRFDWDDPAATAVGVQAAPPYVFLARSGPDPSYGTFQVYELEQGCVSLRQEIPASLPIHSVAVSGDRLVLAELEPPQVYQPAMSLRFFQVRKDHVSTTFAVSLSGPASVPVTVDYATQDGSAVAGADYAAGSGTLRFAPGEVSLPLSVAVRADRDPEPDETFFVNLSNPVGATIESGQAQARIRDDDSAPPGSFFTLLPCRALDTRRPAGLCRGGPALGAGADRVVSLAGRCGIPDTARAVSVNVTVAQPGATGHLRLYPAGTPLPPVSSINYVAGLTRANNAVVGLGASGELAVHCAQTTGTTHVILDVSGYFQ